MRGPDLSVPSGARTTQEQSSTLRLCALGVREAALPPVGAAGTTWEHVEKKLSMGIKLAGGETLHEVLCPGEATHQVTSKFPDSQCGKGTLASYTIHSAHRKDQLLREIQPVP